MKRIKCILFFIFAFCFSMIMPLFCFAAISQDDVLDYEQFLVNQYVDGEYLVGVFDIPVSYSKFTITYPTGQTYNMANGFQGNLKWDEPNPYIFDVYPIGNYYFDATDIPAGTYIVYDYTFDNDGSNADGLEHGKIGFSFGFTASARVFNSNGTLLHPNDMYTGLESSNLYGDFSARTLFTKPNGSKYFQPFISVSLNAPQSIVGTGTRYAFRFKLKTISIMFSMNDINIDEAAVNNRLLSAILNGYKQQQNAADNFKDKVSDWRDELHGIEPMPPEMNASDINSAHNVLTDIVPDLELYKFTDTFNPFLYSDVIIKLMLVTVILCFSSFLLFGKKG